MKPIDMLPDSACFEARAWVSQQTGTPEQLWQSCTRADWMLWLAARIGVDRRLVALAACDCAETAIEYVEPDSVLACVWAIDAARRWARGETDLEEVRASYAAPYAARPAEMATLVREYIPWSVISAALGKAAKP